MASSSYSIPIPGEEEEDTVVLECRELEDELNASVESDLPEITISTAEISVWDLPEILSHRIVRIKTNRKKLVEQSSYFRVLLCGSFSESSNQRIVIRWNLSIFLDVLMLMYGVRVDFKPCSILPLMEAALYFGVETALIECKNWFSYYLTHSVASIQIQLDDLVHFWNYGIENGIGLISGLCTTYMARNFMWAMKCDTFIDIPYKLLLSCIKHPDLTVNSERHLAEALLCWIYAHVEELKDDDNSKIDWIDILKQINVCLLPSWFLMGKQRCQFFSKFLEQTQQSISVIHSELLQSSMMRQGSSDLDSWRIRLTEFIKNIDLSGCPQINATNLSLSLNCCSWHSILGEGPEPNKLNLINSTYQGWLQIKSVVELDLSKCLKLDLAAMLMLLPNSFPSVRTLKAGYFLDFKTKSLQKLAESWPSLDEIDLRVDASPIVPSQASILYSELEAAQVRRMYMGFEHPPLKQCLSTMTKLTLRGRTDIDDWVLRGIGACFVSLCYLDIKDCFSVTDAGISEFVSRCTKLHSFIACDTLFGKNSALALCKNFPTSLEHPENEFARFSSTNLQILHIGGCTGVDETSLLGILSTAQNLISLCLRDTCLNDNVLCNFTGSSLEKLNVSNTMISEAALPSIIRSNPHLKCLKARDCKGLSQWSEADDLLSLKQHEKLSTELGRTCKLEQFAIGWGFSTLSLDTLSPAIRSLKSLTVGLGGSLGEEGLVLLAKLCPKLESITLLFQEVSDFAVIKLMETLESLRVLELCYCIGDLSPLCFKMNAPGLTNLKLERVTPWMTNRDLIVLKESFPHLRELSLIGCKHLDADSQPIISNGWPGLICLCLEECGGVTSRGVGSLLTCKALENLLLRHNGCGIKQNFICHAASELPLLRNISVDRCDAYDGDFDLPLFNDRFGLSSVRISRCKLEKCSLEVHNLEVKRRAKHRETLVLVWNSIGLQRSLIKERLSS